MLDGSPASGPVISPPNDQDALARRRAASRTFAAQQADLLLLSVLARRAATGVDLQSELEIRAEGEFALPAGVIYPALYRLEAAQLVSSRALSLDGRALRLYEITDGGREAYAERLAVWTRHIQKLQAFVSGGA